MNVRVQHIDIAKGISIFLVATYHSPLKKYFPEIIASMSLFRMPLFLFSSGIFFSWIRNPNDFITHKSGALLKPYFSVLLFLLVISYLSGDHALFEQFIGIIYGNGPTIKWTPLWFLTHLFLVYVYAYALFRLCKFHRLGNTQKIAVLIISLATGSLLIKQFWPAHTDTTRFLTGVPGLPFSLDIILISSTYFIGGHLLKDKLINFKPSLTYFVLSITLFLLISVFTNAHIDLNQRVYANPVFATLGALCGIYAIFAVSWFISRQKRIAAIPLRMGQASLFILLFHGFINDKAYHYLSNLATGQDALIICAFIALGLSVSVPLLIKRVVLSNRILSMAFLPTGYNTKNNGQPPNRFNEAYQRGQK